MHKTILTLIFLLLSALSWAQSSTTTMARLQFIHNAPDPALPKIDVYIGNNKFIDNIAFRSATPYLEVPAGTSVSLAIANESSTSAAQHFYTLPVTLVEGNSYIVIADGVRSTIALRPTHPFTLSLISETRTESLIPSNIDIIIHNFSGNPVLNVVLPANPGEASTLDVYYRSTAGGYLAIPAIDHLAVVNSPSNNTRLATYAAQFGTLGLQGRSAVLLSSGFMDPNPDVYEAEYTVLMAVAEGGSLIPLPFLPGTTQSFAQGNITMHPNPAVDFLNFEFPFAVQKIRAQIVDNMGRQVRVIDDFGLRLDVSDLREEVYTINLEIDGRTYTDKFVKGLQ